MGRNWSWRLAPTPSYLSAGAVNNSERLRRTLVANLRARGPIRSDLIEAAFFAVGRLSERAAPGLLASMLTNSSPPLRSGVSDLSGTRPPLLLLYLLLNIPEVRRVSISDSHHLGIGLVDPASQSLAVVSVRSLWREPSKGRVCARWRLDAYGNGKAAAELDRLVSAWQELERDGRRG